MLTFSTMLMEDRRLTGALQPGSGISYLIMCSSASGIAQRTLSLALEDFLSPAPPVHCPPHS